MPVTLGFREGEVVIVVSGAFEGRGVVTRSVGEGAKVPVAFDSGLFGRFVPHQVHAVADA
jgi:transcription antitermination factor NusG